MKPHAPRIFISAAEPSADRHGASLIQAMRSVCPEARFVGVAGPEMLAAGCEAIFDMSAHSAMLLGALKSVGRGIDMLRTSGEYLRGAPFDAAVVIDSPTLHLPLAAQAQAIGIPVLYYIAPQMWAWGAYRMHKLRNRAERVAVILPFEERYFRDRGVDAVYVGHPLAEQLADRPIDDAVVSKFRSAGSPVVAVLPGSRKHVVETILPDQLAVCEEIQRAFPKATFGVSVAGERVAPVVKALVAKSRVAARPSAGHHTELIRAADLVLVASGTTTLEVAFHARPMIVMYQASRLFYHMVGRWMVHTPYLCLPNILARREIVPEFMPYYTSTAPIAERAIELLSDEKSRTRMIDDLNAVVEPLRETRASDRTAELLLDMIDSADH